MPQTRGSFEQALKPLPSVVKVVQACRLPGLKCLKRCAAASSRHSSHCPKCLKRSAAASTRHSGHCPLLLRAFKPAVCQASNASNAARQLRAGTQATALAFKPAVCQASNASNAARQLRAGTQATALCC